MYDEEIQAVLGFYSLSAFVRSKAERRSVQLGVCHVQFALYLKLRCALEYDSGKNYEEFLKKFVDHHLECLTNVMTQNGSLAIRISLLLIKTNSLSRFFGKKFAIIYTGGCYALEFEY